MKATWKMRIMARKPKTHRHKCVVCGKGFKSSRAHARMCSPRCRQILHRRQKQRSLPRASTAARSKQ
jgi:predicted nucleic acid-binding Zn ribbon protein